MKTWYSSKCANILDPKISHEIKCANIFKPQNTPGGKRFHYCEVQKYPKGPNVLIPSFCILLTSVQDTWIFDTDPFCRRRTVDFVAICSTLLNSTVAECLSNYLQEAPLSGFKYSKSLFTLLTFLSKVISSIPFLSFWAVPIPCKSL